MSLQRNVLASFGSQIYVTLVGILMVPMYLRYMGAEAYGLVGFFTMLQAWFSLLDIGLTPTLSRETARHRGGATDALAYRRLVRVLEGIFLAVALIGSVAIFATAGYIAKNWLRVSVLPDSEVLVAIQLMAPTFGLRWMAGLYRGALSGAERLVWLGGFNITIATLRFAGVLPLLMFVGTSPKLFFSYQLVIALLELTILVAQTYKCFPIIPADARLRWEWSALRPVLRFSLSIAFASSIWVLLTQTDKLVLSRILPLAEYGYFTLAVLVASGITILSGPIGNALMPRMALLEAQGKHAQLIQVYRHSTQLVTVIASAASITVAFRAEALLWAWTGNADLARVAAPVLALYALGNGILAVAAFPYYLQFAKGDLRLHMLGNAVFVVLLIPLIVWASYTFGAIGAALVWLGMNLLSFIAWLPLIHRRFEKGLNLHWYTQDTTAIVAVCALASYCASVALPAAGSRADQFIKILLIGLMSLVAGALASSAMRRRVLRLWRSPQPQQG